MTKVCMISQNMAPWKNTGCPLHQMENRTIMHRRSALVHQGSWVNWFLRIIRQFLSFTKTATKSVLEKFDSRIFIEELFDLDSETFSRGLARLVLKLFPLGFI